MVGVFMAPTIFFPILKNFTVQYRDGFFDSPIYAHSVKGKLWHRIFISPILSIILSR